MFSQINDHALISSPNKHPDTRPNPPKQISVFSHALTSFFFSDTKLKHSSTVLFQVKYQPTTLASIVAVRSFIHFQLIHLKFRVFRAILGCAVFDREGGGREAVKGESGVEGKEKKSSVNYVVINENVVPV